MIKKFSICMVTGMSMLFLTYMAYVTVADAQPQRTMPGDVTKPAGRAQTESMGQKEQVSFGVVKQVDPSNNTIVIESRTSPNETRGRDMTFAVEPGAVKGQNLSALQAGQYVQFTRTVKGTKVGPSHTETSTQEMKQPLQEQGEGTKVGPSHKDTPGGEMKQPLQSNAPSSSQQTGQDTAPAMAAAGETITSLEVLPESAWRQEFQRQSQLSR